MPQTCPKCGSNFAEKSLDGTFRRVCPICQATLGKQPAAASDRTFAADRSRIASEPVPYVPKRGDELIDQIGPRATIALGVVFGVMAIISGIGGFVMRHRMEASPKWPTAAATILSSEFKEVRSRPRRHPNDIVSYTVAVSYSYRVNGQSYQGNRIALYDTLWDRASAERRLQKYTTGSTHQVFYDPADLQFAVLEPGDTYEGDTGKVASVMGFWLPIILIVLTLMCIPLYRQVKEIERRRAGKA